MGNSSGGLKSTGTSLLGTNAQGAFVWDWVDQGIRQPVPDAKRAAGGTRSTFFAYGGYWEDRSGIRHDGNFCQNGLVSATGCRIRPRRDQVRLPVPARCASRSRRWNDHGEELVRRGQSEGLRRGPVDILADGRVVALRPVPEIRPLPAQQKTIALGLPSMTAEPGVEYFLNVSSPAEGDAVGAARP